ncbi:MAG: cytochrome c oxidase subunit II [Solirubrobacterales bacterium]|nr:cytochrome c oxidase subunit II [Solirubrobacterales bacterium]
MDHPAAGSTGMPEVNEPNHFLRIVLWWLVVSVIGTALVVFVLGPGLPPGNGSVEASGQVTDNTVLLALSVPVAAAVLVYLTYALIVFREREPEVYVDGPPIRGNASIQLWWLVTTTVIVLFLAGYGSIRLLADGSGGGQGPNPIAAPAASSSDPPLQVQVIAQQWQFNYRFPGYGGVEVPDLELPANTLVEFHVTSLDVIHSFWAYQLGVKADANPGVDNVAYVTTKGPLSVNIRCAELCGVWHGYMFETAHVVSKADFATWIRAQETRFAPATKTLPPYSKTYFPPPERRGG